MKTLGMFVSSLGLGVGIVAHSAVAQTTVAQTAVAFHQTAGSVSPAIVRQQDKQPLEQKLSLQLESVTLATALQEIASQMGLTATFGPIVANDTRRVSVVGKNMLASVALNQVIAGKGIQYAVSGALLVFERKQETAQAQGTVVGRVLHAKTKQPVVGAVVSTTNGNASVKTGEDGRFRLLVSVGKHELQIRAVGFVRQAKPVAVASEEALVIEIVLEPAASVLDEVIVTGTVVATERKAIPNPITVITAEDIEKRGITRIEQLMRGEIPGVLALDAGTNAWTDAGSLDDGLGALVRSTIYTRGASSIDSRNGATTPLKTFVDGVELLDPSYLGTIDPASIERIEVITGPQAATIYGSGAMGGVMQIFTKKGNGHSVHELTAALRYGMLQSNLSDKKTPSHHHVLGMTGGAGAMFTYSGTLSYGYTGQWQPDLFSRRIGGAIGVTSQLNSVTINGSASVTSTVNGTSTYISGGVVGVNKRHIGEWTVSAKTPISKRVSKTSNQTFGLTVDYTMHPSWNHGFTIGRSYNVFAMVPQSPTWASPSDTLFRHVQSGGQRVNWSYNTTLRSDVVSFLSSSLTIGVSGSAGSQMRTQGCTASKTGNTFLACGSYSFESVRAGRSLEDRSWGGFSSWRIGMFEQLYVTLGLRAERNPNYGQDHRVDWTPTNGIAYTVSLGDVTAKFLGSYGRATRIPPAEAREEEYTISANTIPPTWVSQWANPDLRPERSSGPQGGVELYFGNVGSLTVNHYHQIVLDLLERVLVDSVSRVYNGNQSWAPVGQWQNIAKVRQFGWEATGGVNIASFTLAGTYSWNDSRILSVSKNPWSSGPFKLEGMSFVGIPTHTGSIRMSYAVGGTSLSFTTNFIGKSLKSSTTRFGDASLYYGWLNSRERMYIPFQARGGDGALVFSKSGYAKSDINASHTVKSWLRVTLNISNASNSFTSDEGALTPSLGRQTLVGVNLRYPISR